MPRLREVFFWSLGMHWDMTLHNNRSGNICVNRWCNAFRILQGDQFYVDVRP